MLLGWPFVIARSEIRQYFGMLPISADQFAFAYRG
jgi:hypothetical protein